MRFGHEFDRLYATSPDPWGIARAGFRDRVLRERLSPYLDGKSVLELGCGEGHLTRSVFSSVRSVTGVDISQVAIERAKALCLPNADFECRDLLDISFHGYDVIIAIECLYYLSAEEQSAFFDKVTREHVGGVLVLSGPIIGGRYFTHQSVMNSLAGRGFEILEYRNIYISRRAAARPVDLAIRIAGLTGVLDWLPDALVHQRCYVARAAD
jgi:2-polyprenyl-3-methyl-5-hydroxy-6-metoxy-1,4-benzoquinol methylase